jgi:O-antigen ligase
MPKNIFGIQGFNPWNILMLSVLVGWLRSADRSQYKEYFPKKVKFLFVWYLGLMAISHIRLLLDMDGLVDWMYLSGQHSVSKKSLFSEQIINSYKWLVPAYLVYVGCNSQKRFNLVVLSIIGIYLILGLQVIKWMPLGNISGGNELSERSLKILVNEIGYHRVNLSMMLASGFWAVISSLKMARKTHHTFGLILSSLAILLGQVLTGGRTGYVTWAIVGLTIGFVKWRKIIFIAPVVGLLFIYTVPGVYERMTHGIVGESVEEEVNTRAEDYSDVIGNIDENTNVNVYAITSGRSIAWPFVLEKIAEQPLFGYGRMAMVNSGITAFLWEAMREGFPHPHNAYLELILDNGLIGAVPVFILFLTFFLYSISLLRDNDSNNIVIAGGIAISLITAFLVASIGSQTFYPREGSVGMWCAIALALRFYINRKASQELNVEMNDGFIEEQKVHKNER